MQAASLGAAGLAAAGAVATRPAQAAEATAQEPKKIMVLLGSGYRDSNTGKVVDAFKQGAEEAGHQVDVFFLTDMNIGTCRGCGYCRQEGNGTCIQDDDMTQIYDAFDACDMIVYASPMRYFMFTGVLKNAIERFYAKATKGTTPRPHEAHEYYPKKDALLIMCSYAEQSWYDYSWVKNYWEVACVDFWLFNNKGTLFCDNCGGSSYDGDDRHVEDSGHLEEAYELGKTIYGTVDNYELGREVYTNEEFIDYDDAMAVTPEA